jgi:RNA polymerase sigma-70 factor (ECF subfamily)
MASERPAELSELLTHAAWLRRLANQLVRGTGEGAGDLVQETWMAALRSPPSSERPARPWLAEVLRNAFRKRWRARGRLERREAAASPPDLASPSPEQLLERAEVQRRLGEMVLALDEPYRSTILLRYFEDMAPVEIARLMNEPAGTVRWRLNEAHRRLRASLVGRERGEHAEMAAGALVPLLPQKAPATLGWSMKGVLMATVVTAKTKLGVVGIVAALLALGAGAGLRSRMNHRSATAVAPGQGPPGPAGQAGTSVARAAAVHAAVPPPRLRSTGAANSTSTIYGPSRDVEFEELAPQFRAVISQIAMGRKMTEFEERRDILAGGQIRTRVTFHVEGVRHEVMMNQDGKLVASEVDFQISELPAVVTGAIKTAFPEAVIVEADRQWREGKPVYFDVDMTREGKRFEAHVSEQGQIVQTKWK